jgi:hypothetical protein
MAISFYSAAPTSPARAASGSSKITASSTAIAPVGRIYRVNDYPPDQERWFWGVRFELTGRKSYGDAATLDEAKESFRAEYDKVAPLMAPTKIHRRPP